MKPKRGQLFVLKPDAEGKRRPLVIISRDPLNGGHSVLAVPFYSQQIDKRREQEWCEPFYRGEGGLDKDCVAKCDEVSLINKLDIDLAHGPLGPFDASQMDRLMRAVEWAIGLDP